ncbi:MAG: hypothetical protein LUG47_04955 [Clostridiales bacterium]|nr:hypothetical protein [Clostridiales bacterium]
MYYLLMWGVIFHASLLFCGNLMGATTLFEMAEMLSDSNFIVAGLCWVPSLCYIAFCLCFFLMPHSGVEMIAVPAFFIIGLPIVCILLQDSVWALIGTAVVVGVLSLFMGPLAAVLLIGLILLIPGVIVGACALVAIGVFLGVISVLSAIIGSSFLLSAIFCVLIAGLIIWFLIVRPVKALIQKQGISSKVASIATLVCACVGIFIGARTILFNFMVFF